MQIKSINRDKKHLTKLIFTDGKEVLLDNDIVAQAGIFVGLEIDSSDLEKLKFDSDYARAKSRALWYLDRMDYTEKALYDKLLKAGFDKKVSARVLSKLCELELIDDRRFAERMAERFCENNISKREALHKMFLKGVPYDLAKEVLSNVDADEESQISALLEGKYSYKITQEKGAEKVFAALIRKGFSYGAVRIAMKKYIDEQEICEEF